MLNFPLLQAQGSSLNNYQKSIRCKISCWVLDMGCRVLAYTELTRAKHTRNMNSEVNSLWENESGTQIMLEWTNFRIIIFYEDCYIFPQINSLLFSSNTYTRAHSWPTRLQWNWHNDICPLQAVSQDSRVSPPPPFFFLLSGWNWDVAVTQIWLQLRTMF